MFLSQELQTLCKGSGDMTLFYFCRFEDKDRNNETAVLRSLLYQLFRKNPSLTNHAFPHFDQHGRAGISAKSRISRNSPEILWDIFKNVLQDPALGTVFCVLDGLDECDAPSSASLVAKFQQLFTTSPKIQQGAFKLVIVSRHIRALECFPQIKLDPDHDEFIHRDIRRFISVRVRELPAIEGVDETFRTQVENRLMKKSQGSFLWVAFVILELSRQTTATAIETALNDTPVGLHGMFARALLQIEPRHRQDCSRIFQWVSLAVRPLTVSELGAATKTLGSNLISAERAIQDKLTICGPLLQIRGGRVGFIHESVREYFLREKEGQIPGQSLQEYEILEAFRIDRHPCHRHAAHRCLEAIESRWEQSHRKDWQPKPCSLDPSFRRYAVTAWLEHARRCEDNMQGIFNFSRPFFSSPGVSIWWYKNYCSESEPSYTCLQDHCNHPLPIACATRIVPWVKALINKRRKTYKLRRFTNSSPELFDAVLQAVDQGDIQIVEMLLKAGAPADDWYEDEDRPMDIARNKGYDSIVKLLQKHGAQYLRPSAADGGYSCEDWSEIYY